MRITINLDTDNASMETETEYQYEVTRIIKDIASKIANGLGYCKIRDLNGNSIGYYQVDNMPSYEEDENNENE